MRFLRLQPQAGTQGCHTARSSGSEWLWSSHLESADFQYKSLRISSMRTLLKSIYRVTKCWWFLLPKWDKFCSLRSFLHGVSWLHWKYITSDLCVCVCVKTSSQTSSADCLSCAQVSACHEHERTQKAREQLYLSHIILRLLSLGHYLNVSFCKFLLCSVQFLAHLRQYLSSERSEFTPSLLHVRTPKWFCWCWKQI